MKNKHGLDVSYFKDEFKKLSDSIDGMTPKDLCECLINLYRNAEISVKLEKEQPCYYYGECPIRDKLRSCGAVEYKDYLECNGSKVVRSIVNDKINI